MRRYSRLAVASPRRPLQSSSGSGEARISVNDGGVHARPVEKQIAGSGHPVTFYLPTEIGEILTEWFSQSCLAKEPAILGHAKSTKAPPCARKLRRERLARTNAGEASTDAHPSKCCLGDKSILWLQLVRKLKCLKYLPTPRLHVLFVPKWFACQKNSCTEPLNFH